MSDQLERLMDLIEKRFKFGRGKIAPDDDLFEKLGITSLQALELIGDLEREFQVEIPDYELKTVRTARGIEELVQKWS
jgi:acyl carrier protein